MLRSLSSLVRRALLLGVLLLGASASRAAAVSVSPSALYIDARTRSGILTLVNTGTRAEEIEITFAFGYPMVDSLGNVGVVLVTAVPDSEPSAVAWLRAFPRRLRLEPGQRQVVRVMVQAPANLPPGEYWGRVLVRSRGAQPPVEQQTEQIRLNVEVETVIATAVSYRAGSVTTGLEIGASRAMPADSVVRVALALKRTGNAAFLGRVQMEVLAPNGERIATHQEDIAVYRTLPRTFVIPVRRRPASWAGYTVRYVIDTERPDLPPEGPISAPRIEGRVPLS